MQVGIKEFQKKFPGILKEAPFDITCRGYVVAHVIEPQEEDDEDDDA